MGGNDENLTHEEMWDDSALIDSWNDALAEYKKYHSIHAKGGSLKDLEALELERSKALEEEAQKPSLQESPPASDPTKASDAGPSLQAVGAPPIQMMLGSVKDDSLKKLLMSWYYAGYYTGLYEGQQHAEASNQ
ncbi:SMN family protein Smn1 [Sarocladium strictum]